MIVIFRSRSCSIVRLVINARNAASRRNQHRDKAFSRQTKPPKQAVHDERHARHVAAVFKNGKQEKQNENLRHKAENRADAADYSDPESEKPALD